MRQKLLFTTLLSISLTMTALAGIGEGKEEKKAEDSYVIPFQVELTPNKKKVVVSTDMRRLEVDLIDMNGNILRTVVVDGNQARINIKDLDEGMYFIIAPVGYIPFEI
jgi:hypothetical protein